MKRRKQDPRAKASGFARQLRAFFHAAEEAWKRDRRDAGPSNPYQLAAWLKANGEKASPRACGYWADAINLPGSRYVALIEELLGAPWIYLDRASNPPVTDRDRAEFLMRHAGDPKDRERWALALRQLDAPKGRA